MKKLFPLLILVFAAFSMAQTAITGRVVGVTDGDTITILDASNVQHKIRLAGIDAPEKGQDFGNRAKQNLSAFVFGNDVTVIGSKIDRYGRRVGKVIVNGRDAGLDMVTAGLAWHFKQYENEQTPADRRAYSVAERTARDFGMNIWSYPNPVAPWDYRHPATNRKTVPGSNGQRSPAQVRSTESTAAPLYAPPRTEAESSRTLNRGSRGGCYYTNSNGNKTYVDRGLCN